MSYLCLLNTYACLLATNMGYEVSHVHVVYPGNSRNAGQVLTNLYKQLNSLINVIHDLKFLLNSMLSCELCAKTFDKLADYNAHKLEEHKPKKSYGNPLFTTSKPPKQGKPKEHIDLSNFVELFDPKQSS